MLVVSLRSLKSSFLNIPPSYADSIYQSKKSMQQIVLEVTWNQTKAYFSWSGFTSTPENGTPTVEIDSMLGQELGLEPGTEINLRLIMHTKVGASISVEPVTEDDWEIVEGNAGFLEDEILKQVRVFYPKQVLIIWIHQVPVRLRVVDLSPASEKFIVLQNSGEVFVCPKPRAISTAGSDLVNPTVFKMLRLLPASCGLIELSEEQEHAGFICIVGKSEDLAQDAIVKLEVTVLESASAVGLASKKKGEADHGHLKPTTIHYARVKLDERIPKQHVLFNSLLWKSMIVDAFSIISVKTTPLPDHIQLLEYCRIILPQPRNIPIAKNSQQNLEEHVKTWLKSLEKGAVISSGALIHSTNHPFFIHFMPQKTLNEEEPVYLAIVDGLNFDKWKFTVEDSKLSAPSLLPVQMRERQTPKLGGVSEILKEALEFLRVRFAPIPVYHTFGLAVTGGMLIIGRPGSGKTSLISAILEKAKNAFINSVFVNCIELAEDRLVVINEKLQKALDEAAWKSPSILVFDNLERLAPAELEHKHADSTRSRHIAERITEMLNSTMKRHQIMILASCSQQDSLHEAVLNNHLFRKTITLKPPGKLERGEILEVLLADNKWHDYFRRIDSAQVATETEGFLPVDFKALVEKAAFAGLMRKNNEGVAKMEDFSRVLKSFLPTSLKSIKLQSSEVKWSDIGGIGLRDTRRILRETLDWPTKYSAIFNKCPLRLRSGLLLYGYPGCGKTMLASAVAKECGLNFISVKGPELLNKYIGASEKSVRDLFERAESAKPCVLFFDEFESIAPRRGHDSTGVTDRIVNQLLTQMDGAEGLEGVYVLAATSRPDLIDPALLRPGRLDKSLLCNMPNVKERKEILQALANSFDLGSELDLEELAQRCEGYSGADLQALLYNAHLEVIHETMNQVLNTLSRGPKVEAIEYAIASATETKNRLSNAESSEITAKLGRILNNSTREKDLLQTEGIIIESRHVTKVMNELRPSLTQKERHRLQLIYEEFMQGRDANMPTGMGPVGIGSRVSLG